MAGDMRGSTDLSPPIIKPVSVSQQ